MQQIYLIMLEKREGPASIYIRAAHIYENMKAACSFVSFQSLQTPRLQDGARLTSGISQRHEAQRRVLTAHSLYW